MRIAQPATFWIGVSAVALVALVLLREILLPFVVGTLLAYLLVPAVDRLERFGINRTLAALAVFLPLIVGIIGLMLVMLPVIIGELRFFVEEFPRYITRLQSLATDASGPWMRSVIGENLHIEQSSVDVVRTVGSKWLDGVVTSLWSSGRALISLLSLLVVTPIIAIYLVIDWHRMIATVDGWFAPEYRDDIRALGREIHDTVAGFVRGQVVICLVLAVIYAAALKLTGLNHAILIGITAGLISFVPYLGAASGILVSVCVAVDQFWPDWAPVAVVGGIFIVGEMLADYVLSPRLIGRRVNLNPVWMMFALFAFGWLFGFIGVLLAIPIAASLGVILRFARRKSLASAGHDVSAGSSTEQ
ncbi:AI-2E family transporter [Mesorhizobium ventifaucium]|uniref:Permease often clustered with de novo purine synthesis n=1 Tax=Mesorhizobium ventifaucium TaxID=666020 RepID=A0ABM9E142_9HYPH|nr:AI-2E family transporter [Mesorhizobium ventifaucium]CAH2402786.1 Putative permease often clustered with de novo purine synthesis [Mesorhizobium ventifaucium]